MVFTKSTALLRSFKLLKGNNVMVTNVRNGGHGATWNYRCGPPPPPKTDIYIAESAGGVMWWWVLWHLWTEPGHVFGEFEYPDVSKWTDEELGIPAEE